MKKLSVLFFALSIFCIASMVTVRAQNPNIGNITSIKVQNEIIYLCFKLTDLATREFQWCFTNANAAERITKFYNKK